MVSASSNEKIIKNLKKKNKTELSTAVAESLAKKALEKKLQEFILIEVFTNITVELRFLQKH